MKKATIFATFLVSAALFSGSSAVCATNTATVFVTIADAKGNLALAQEGIRVTDCDGDGALTVNDALCTAHKEKFNLGVDGYASQKSEYGLGITKLWGAEAGSAYGYYVNDKSAFSLEDPIKEGDRINAYVFTDLTSFSDTYCYFDSSFLNVNEDESFTLTLSAAAFDAEWNPITVPVKDAVITLNGEKTNIKTDESGKATIFAKAGKNVVSAVSDTMTLVPPVCTINAAAKPVQTETSPVVTESAPKAPVEKTPDTGAAGAGFFALSALTALAALLIKKR